MTTDNIVQGRLKEYILAAIDGYFQVDSWQFDVPFANDKHAIRLAGRFHGPTEDAYDVISARAAKQHFSIYFRAEEQEQIIYAVPGELQQHRSRYALSAALFVTTLLAVFLTGAILMKDPATPGAYDIRSGLAYAIPLMTILLAHELGHYFVGRHYGMAVSPPYFIPLPLISLGTLGAVIVMKAPPKNRKQLLQLGAAGPLAGLVIAIPVLYYGLVTSEVGPLPTIPFMMEGNSLFYAGAKFLVFHQFLPGGGLDVQINNIAFAGWVGLLITALNLIPAGQLDGGHAIYTLFGNRVHWLTWLLIAILVGLAAYTQFWGWLLWAALLFFFGKVYAVPLDDLTPLDLKHKVLAASMLVLWVLLFVPLPLQLITP